MNCRIIQTAGALLLSLGLTLGSAAQEQDVRKPENSDIENIGKRNINRGQTNFTSIDREIALGREAAKQFEQGRTFVDDAAVNAYVDRIAQNIARNSDSQFPIAIRIVQDKDVNAFALPGGFIYVNSGVIQAVDNEAELAFVIAQLAGHVSARHATESEAKDAMIQNARIPQLVLTGGVLGGSIQDPAQLGIPIAMFHFQQEAASEADFLGLEYLYKAGYDPQAAVSYLRKVEALETAAPVQSPLFATVPPAATRLKLTIRNIESVLPSRADNVLDTSEFVEMKARLMRLHPNP